MDTIAHAYDGEKIRPIKSIKFTILGNDEIKGLSALGKDSVGIDIPDLYDNLEAKRGGLIDSRMGTTDNNVECATCGLSTTFCVGHFGHIVLAKKVFHLGYLNYVKKILSCICLKCSRLLIYKNEDEIIDMLKNKTNKQRWAEIRNLVKNVSHCQKQYSGCGMIVSKIKIDVKKSTGAINIISETNLTNIPAEEGIISSDGKKKISYILTPDKCYNILANISDRDCLIMGIDPEKCRPEMMIHKVFPVPPVAVRPSTRADYLASSTAEDDLTHKLADIIKANLRIIRHEESATEASAKYGQENVYLLQYHVATYFDNETLTLPKSEKGKETRSISYRLKGKEGRIRGNLMGKRVDFSGRTVITSDPTIDINQLGVPIKIAMNITFPEIVTPHNIEHMTQLIRNGRDKYPGANFVFQSSSIIAGQRVLPIDLRYKKDTLELRYGDIVERHFVDGDIVLLNRQPTLHKQSMMGHIIKVINNSHLNTFRLNVNVCAPYNADFDGDEMNIFLPQSIQTKIELQEIADVKRQIISPSSSRTCIGIAQDGLLGAYNLTAPTTRIDRKNAMNIVSYTSFENFNIFKNKKEITGHELFSLIIPDRINVSKYDDGKPILVIKNGVLTDGYLKKDWLGAGKKNNLIQLVWDEYGVKETKDFLDNISRLVNNYNLYNGFTVGMGDITVSKDVEQQIQKILETKEIKIANMITEIENNPELMDEELFEKTLFAELNVARDDVGKLIQNNNSPTNNINIMSQSGSKGDATNTGQMSGCVGLQTVEGKLVKKKINGRTLPYFHENDDTAVARGLVKQSFLKGLRFPEFIFKNMAAREGLIDGAVKTAESGYLQRKLIKSMEDAMIKYDKTVRTANNGILQFIYGDSGTDTIKQYEHTIKLIEMGNNEIMKKYCFTDEELKGQKNYSKKENEEYFNILTEMRDNLRTVHLKTKLNMVTLGTSYMLPINIYRVVENIRNNNEKGDKLEPSDVINGLDEVIEKTRLINLTKEEKKNKKNLRYLDDKVAKTIFKIALYEYLSPKRCIIDFKLNKKQFEKIVYEFIQNFNKNMIEPGEMVGIIAAQAMGEPITQMSCEKNTLVLIKNKSTNEMFYGTISNFIDNLLEQNKNDVKDVPEHDNSVVLDLKDDYCIIGVSDDGKTSWNRIQQISRHPTNGNLMKVTTKSNRSTITTLSHSHLSLVNNKIVPIRGSDIKVGDKIPVLVSVNMPSEFNNTNNITDIALSVFYNKTLPPCIFDTNKEFIAGLFKEYIKINGQLSSSSKEVINGMSILLTYFGICGSFIYEINNDNIIYKYLIDNKDLDKLNNISVNINNDIMWDEIETIEILNDPQEYVYDFTVPGNDSFMVDNGILVHNTLNAFHSSGISQITNTTTGTVRIKEILSLSKKIKTPQMIVSLVREHMNSRDMANKIGSHIKYITIAQLRKKIDIYYEPDPFVKGSFREQDNVYNVFYGHNPGKNSCQADIANLPWLMRIELDREKLLEKEVTLLDIKSKFCNAWEKRFLDLKSNKKEERAIFDKVTQCAILSNTNNDDVPIIHLRFEMSEIDFTTINEFIDTIIDKFKLKGITSINNSFVSEERILTIDNPDKAIEKQNHFMIYTEGVNLYDIRYIMGIDIYKTICNDIVQIYETFGIEAARLSLIREIVSVYDRAGKSANFQHLTILADIMTNGGQLISIDRHGMNKSDNDPLSKASFEKTVDQLLAAAVFGETDHMKGISSRIMAGMVIKGGTGLCDLLLDTNMIEKSEFTEDIGQKYIKTYNEITTSSVIEDMVNKGTENEIFIPEY